MGRINLICERVSELMVFVSLSMGYREGGKDNEVFVQVANLCNIHSLWHSDNEFFCKWGIPWSTIGSQLRQVWGHGEESNRNLHCGGIV